MAISLESLQHGQTLDPPRILIYGTPGVGKTSFAAAAPKPVFIMTEKGKGRLSFSNFPLATKWEDVEGAVEALLNEDHEFETVVVDSIDWLEPLIHDKICRDEDKKSIEDFGYGKGYTKALDVWEEFFAMLDALNSKGMIVIIVGHSQVKLFNSPDTENYDRYQLNIHAKAAEMAKEWADAVLFANYDVKVKTHTENGKTKGKAVRMDSVPRLIYTEERPAFWAKNRYCLPPKMELSWPVFEDGMEKGIEELASLTAELKKK